jgi:ribosomal protein S18 acetylase RimI-like enzyme
MAVAAIVRPGITHDRWLSDLLGRPAWKVEAHTSSPADAIGHIGDGPAFFFTRIATNDVRTLNHFEDAGFRIIDLTVTLEAPAAQLRDVVSSGVRFARPSDKSAVWSIALNGFESSRLHLDPLIPKAVADRSRAQWATNFFSGSRGDAMVVAEHEGAVVAFLLLVGPAAGTLIIDLTAVRSDARGIGLGTACIRFAAVRIAGCERLRVGTQVANVGALRFYERLGFQTVASHYVLHLHRA